MELTTASVAADIIVRLVYTPSSTLASDYTWRDLNMTIIFLVESNLTIIAAAYPATRGFLTKVSTGFLVPAAKGDSQANSKGGSYGLQTIGGSGGAKESSHTRNSERQWEAQKRYAPGWKNSYHAHAAAVQGDARSDRSYGSEVIMVRQSVDVEDQQPEEA